MSRNNDVSDNDLSSMNMSLALANQARDSKRRHMESLHKRKLALQHELQVLDQEMAGLEVELMQLDDDIDQMETAQLQNQQLQQRHRQAVSVITIEEANDDKEEQPGILQAQAPPPDESVTKLTPLTLPSPFGAAMVLAASGSANMTLKDPPNAVTATTGVKCESGVPGSRPTSRASSNNSSSGPLEIETIAVQENNSTSANHLRKAAAGECLALKLVGKKRPRDPADSEASSLQVMSQLPMATQLLPPPPPSSSSFAATATKRANYAANPSSVAAAAASTTTFPWTGILQELLHSTFNIPSFREHQREIIDATLEGHNVFVLMRTGGGKSLTYQLPALYEGRMSSQNKLTFVISPLLSLIQDQEEQMNELVPGSAVSFSSGLQGGNTEHARRWGLVRDPEGGVCLVFVTPEKVHKSNKLRNELQKLYDQGRLGRFVVDEAHCSSTWGSDFRPDYAKLGILKRHFPSIPILAVTATASERVRQDVCQILGIARNYQFFRSTAHRPNLQYSIRPKTGGDADVLLDMVEWIQEHCPNESGIVYTLSRKDADSVARGLDDQGIVSRAYHSDVSPKQKERIHRDWMSGKVQVVVATIAFGLGINKPNVRFVLHHCISKTLEAYYQESGRAGRDGEQAYCVLFYSPKDVIRMRTLVHESNRGGENLIPMIRYAQASGNDAVCKAIIMDNLGEPNAKSPAQVEKENDGITTNTRDVGIHGQIVARLIQDADQDVTMSMLVKQWRSKTAPRYVLDHSPAQDDLTVDECERIIVALLVENILCFYIHWTAYQAVAYLRLASRANQLLQSSSPKILVKFPKRVEKPKRPSTAGRKKNLSAPTGEWLETKPKAKRKKSDSAMDEVSNNKRIKKAPAVKKKRASTKKKDAKAATRKQKASSSRASSSTAETEVIDLFSDEEKSSNDNEGNDDVPLLQLRENKIEDALWRDMDDVDDDDEENEFV